LIYSHHEKKKKNKNKNKKNLQIVISQDLAQSNMQFSFERKETPGYINTFCFPNGEKERRKMRSEKEEVRCKKRSSRRSINF